MKIHWEPSDIIPGRYVCKPFNPGSDIDWIAKHIYKIGYCGGSSTYSLSDGDSGVCLISMTDGMVTHATTQEELAQRFNEDGRIPCPHDILIKVITRLRDSYQTPFEPLTIGGHWRQKPFQLGDRVKALIDITFADNTKHVKGQFYEVTKETQAYFSINAKDYEKVE